jgi:ATP-dependent helicase/nuclease subunit B
MRARGNLAGLAAAFDTPPGDTPPEKRPSPRPPVAARPRSLSVTEIKTLIRDPYAIYARHVLR